VWVRANDNAFVSEFQINSGKIGQARQKDLGARVVQDLMKGLEGKHHHVYFDSYFTAVAFVKALQDKGIYVCGTMKRKSVGMPDDSVSVRHMRRGKSEVRSTNSGIAATLWKDRKGIIFLSNFHYVIDVSCVTRKKKDGASENISCPQIVKEYNANMGFVDKADLLKSLYELDRKSQKWWLWIFWLDVSVISAVILFKERSLRCGNTQN
jgi:hypothetical protein